MFFVIGWVIGCSVGSSSPSGVPTKPLAVVVDHPRVEPLVMPGWTATRLGSQRQRKQGDYKPPPQTPRLLVVWFQLENTGTVPAQPGDRFDVVDKAGKVYGLSTPCLAQPADGEWFSEVAVGENKRVKLCFEVPGDDTEEVLWLRIRTPEKSVKIQL